MYIFEYISNLGSTVMVPIMFAIIALVFGLGLAKSFKVGLTIGIGFLGLNLVIGLFWTYLSPAAALLLEKFGLKLGYIDGGWMTGAAIGFASPVGTFIIPFALAVNIILLATNLTKTLNVDIWNFWHFCFYGGIAYKLTGSIIWGYVMAGVMAALSLKFGDMGAKYIEEEMGIPGISVPQCFAASTIPLGLLLDKLYDKIPGLNKVNVNTETLSKRLGVFGEPASIGFALGLVISIAVGYDFKTTIETSIAVAALLLLMPRMVKILMEGLIPLSEAASAFMHKRFEGKEFYIGLDSAITLANPTTIAVSVAIIPITILIALLPFNTVLPAGDLAAGAYYVCFFSMIHRGDFLKTLLSGSLLMVAIYALMSTFAPMINELAIAAGYVTAGAELGISAGVNVVAGPLLLFVRGFGGNLGGFIMVAVGVAVFVVCHMLEKRKPTLVKNEVSVKTLEK
jgi:PTS system galactitol-specific IIC component